MTDLWTKFISQLNNYHDAILQICPFRNISGNDKHLFITLNFPCIFEHDRLKAIISQIAQKNQQKINKITIKTEINQNGVQGNLTHLSGVKNIIAIASGKGGVGKSTVAVNLAIALDQQGAKSALLDADIYGPSQAHLLGGKIPPQTRNGRTMLPIYRHNIQTMSIADLIDEDSAIIWRGALVSQTLIQLLKESEWSDVDYLIIDLPPGTGDVQLTLAQQIPVAGAVIVTTPQEIALLDAKKAKIMFDKVQIPILGMVENMAHYCCPNCGFIDPIFTENGGVNLANSYQLPLLGQIPLDKQICQDCDEGNPTTFKNPHSKIAQIYQRIASTMAAQLSAKANFEFPIISSED